MLAFPPSFQYIILLYRLQKHFYGPVERRMFLSGLLRATVWKNIIRSWKRGVNGNLEGEGRILGGTVSDKMTFS